MVLIRPGARATVWGATPKASTKRAVALCLRPSREPAMVPPGLAASSPLRDRLEAGARLGRQRREVGEGGHADAASHRLGYLVEDLAQRRFRGRRHQGNTRAATEAQLGVERDLAHER